MNSIERRGTLENPVTPLSFPAEWLLDIWNGGRTDSGIRVSELTAMQVSCVFAAVNIITSAIGVLPLHVYKQELEGKRLSKTIDLEHDLYDMLHFDPNPEMTSFTFRRTFMCHALLWGNAYAELQRDKGGRVCAMWPRNPARTRPVRLEKPFVVEGTPMPIGSLVYKVDEPFGGSQIEDTPGEERIEDNMRFVLPKNILHVKGLSLDGRVGQDTVNLARQAIGLSLAEEKYAAKFFGNSAIPKGILGIPGALDPEEAETAKRSWQEAYGGENAQRVAVLEPGMTFVSLAVDPTKGQMNESRAYQATEIAAVFNLPLHMLAQGSNRISEKTAENIGTEFVNFTLKPWLISIQQEFVRKLLPKEAVAPGSENIRSHICDFDTRSLTFPDAASRAMFYDGGRQWGYLSTNDVLDFEGMNPASELEADKYFVPTNWRVMGDETPKPKNNALGVTSPAPTETPAEKKSREIVETPADKFFRNIGKRTADFDEYKEVSRKAREADPYFAPTPDAFKKKS